MQLRPFVVVVVVVDAVVKKCDSEIFMTFFLFTMKCNKNKITQWCASWDILIKKKKIYSYFKKIFFLFLRLLLFLLVHQFHVDGNLRENVRHHVKGIKYVFIDATQRHEPLIKNYPSRTAADPNCNWRLRGE